MADELREHQVNTRSMALARSILVIFSKIMVAMLFGIRVNISLQRNTFSALKHWIWGASHG